MSSSPYNMSYVFSLARLEQAGGYQLFFSYDAVVVANGSARMLVTHTPAVSAVYSRVIGYGAGTPYADDGSPPSQVLTILTAGVNYSLSAIAYDPFGNQHTYSRPGFTLDAAFLASCAAASSTELGNGRTSLTYQLQRTGNFTVSVLTASGALVSRGLVVVLPGPLNTTGSTASWSNSTAPVAGRPLTLNVALRDQFANPLTSSPGSSLLAVLLPTFGLPTSGRRSSLSTVTFNPTVAGLYTAAVYLAGVQLSTGLPPLVVQPGPVSVPNSQVTGSATIVGYAQSFNLLVLARDAYNNDLGAAPLAARVTGVTGMPTTASWSYTVAYSASVAANISVV
ncbi:hypothetical protein HaLaN_10046 [Haematococcus lacustris]|uniref:Uncharacterized protein n=1 Tax=Haematococcus lacustris TaxID=44745 RepID=A0A699YUZ9_HAELA|nr:hypothetical protein HaLaN_10046 [Haematococcus lacustris]